MCDDFIHQGLTMIPLFRAEPLGLEQQRLLC